jgi:hypothetical protein
MRLYPFKIPNIGLYQAEMFIGTVVGEIFRPAGGVVVQHDDIAALFKQPVHDMASDKSGPAGNNAFHTALLAQIVY